MPNLEELKSVVDQKFKELDAVIAARASGSQMFKSNPEQVDKILFEIHEFIIENFNVYDRDNVTATENAKDIYIKKLLELKKANESYKSNPNQKTLKELKSLLGEEDPEEDFENKDEPSEDEDPWKYLCKFLQNEKQATLNILEVGCGLFLMPIINLLGGAIKAGIKLNYVGIDPDEAAIEENKKVILMDKIANYFEGDPAYKAECMQNLKNLKFICGDAGKLETVQNAFFSDAKADGQSKKIDIIIMQNPRVRSGFEPGFMAFRCFFKEVLPKVADPQTKILVVSDDLRDYRTFVALNPLLQTVYSNPSLYCSCSELSNGNDKLLQPKLTVPVSGSP